MPHNDYLKPGGVWGLFSVFTSALAAQMDLYLFQSVNGDTGGVWAPSLPVTFGGSGVQVFGPLVATDAQITVTTGKFVSIMSGANLVVNSGAEFFMNGTMKVQTGNIWVYGPSLIQMYGTFGNVSGIVFNNYSAMMLLAGSSITLSSGTTLACAAGSTVSLAGTTTFPTGSLVLNQSALGIQFTGVQPAKNVDPGANNLAIGTNQIKALGVLTSEAGVGVSCIDGMNVASVGLSGSNRGWTVTLARGMATTSYGITATYRIFPGFTDAVNCWVPKVTVTGLDSFKIELQKSNTEAYADLTAGSYAVSFEVTGRQ